MNPPTDFLCPITKKLMKDPVMSVQGVSFERAAILEWLSSHEYCPARGTPLKASSLRTNTKLQWKIRYWEFKQPNDDDEEEDHQKTSSESQHDSSSIKRFLCPLSNQVMEDPVTTRDGHSYDRRALLKFFEKHGEISPFSGKPLRGPSFYANKKLGWEIRHWKETLRQQKNPDPPTGPEPATTSVQEEVKSKPQEKTAETKTYTMTTPSTKKSSADVPRSSVSSQFLHSQVLSTVGGEMDMLAILNEVCDMSA